MDLQFQVNPNEANGDQSFDDWALPPALEQLMLDGDDEIVAEIFSLFCSDTAARLRMARIAMETGDRARIRAEAHAIKGSAVQMGADELASSCEELEIETPGKPVAELSTLLARVEERFERAVRGISGRCGR